MTLYSASTVLVVAGLIVSGTFYGQAHVEALKAEAVLAEARDLSRPVAEFRDRFQALPGDMMATAAQGSLGISGGDGNGVIGSLSQDPMLAPGSDADAMREQRRFWNHLNAAGLGARGLRPVLSDQAIDDPEAARFGALFPESRISGAGWTTLRATLDAGTLQARTAVWLRLHKMESGGEVRPALSPELAALVDQMGDDGRPDAGRIRSLDTGAGPCRDPAEPGRYADPLISRNIPTCLLLIELL